ncbi:hypothetical protein DICVIV_06390 [Dictyocaulus viviparus]|uniref:Major facilitator superfamily (MFS) profile domain-containing protein n=1 Tax=Dictyocaulus viviparus TaxID=29172 RepID=A0A0D8XS84_DICVI|nr:hypothetical protein DICVIV_06390 [Dictyocaulus viviparus]
MFENILLARINVARKIGFHKNHDTNNGTEPGSGRVSGKDSHSASTQPTSRSTNTRGGRAMVTSSTSDPYVEKLRVVKPRVYKRRWAILVMFILLSASNGAQWIMYSVIAQIVADFYNVSFSAVDWTSMIYMATYIMLFIPAAKGDTSANEVACSSANEYLSSALSSKANL